MAALDDVDAFLAQRLTMLEDSTKGKVIMAVLHHQVGSLSSVYSLIFCL